MGGSGRTGKYIRQGKSRLAGDVEKRIVKLTERMKRVDEAAVSKE